MIDKRKSPNQIVRRVNKTCKKCGIKLDKENAIKYTHNRGYVHPNCRSCKREINRKHMKKKADTIKAHPLW